MSFSAAQLRAALDAHVPPGAVGLVVGLSGGGDSAALLAAMSALGGDFRALPLRAVHIDHGLQSAAVQFRDACAALCNDFHVPLSIVSVRVQAQAGDSIEEAARDARYAALAAQLHPNECLLTAHHRKDQAETLLLQALRGAGVRGMSAMPYCRVLGQGWHVRPLLGASQSELLQLAATPAHLISADPMNDDMRFDRSYLRRQIWPALESRWPGAQIALSRTAGHMAEAQALLDDVAAADLARLRDGEALSVPGLRALSSARCMNAVRFWLGEAHVEPPSMARLSEALRQIFDAQIDQLPCIVWGDRALRRYRQRLLLTEASPPRLQARPWLHPLESGVELAPNLGVLAFVAQSGGIVPGALPDALMVRARAGGETLKPGRAAKTQSLQHLFQSQGVLPWMRDALPLVFAGDALIAVGDLWVDARWCAAPDAPGFALQWHNAPIYS
jgi:tRNA(Ile)-lysidine synthase